MIDSASAAQGNCRPKVCNDFHWGGGSHGRLKLMPLQHHSTVTFFKLYKIQ